jgi:glycosyltransferase involved in cell wall biosynthesis
MKIASITAGAAGMYCGSCMRDNTLAAALNAIGHETLLLPTYTPIRTDEPDVSRGPIFFGGVNVYLRQKFRLFRWTPWWLDKLFNSRGLLRWVSRFAMSVRAEELGKLTVSMLQGESGEQKKGVDELAAWLEHEFKPDAILLTNVLLSGIVPELRRRLGVPIVATLQGDDIFLESLPPDFRAKCLELIRSNCAGVDGYIATCRYYADFMAGYLGLPRERFHVVYPGINLAGFDSASPAHTDDVSVIGYFARIAPEKGLHLLADAFIHLRQQPGAPRCKLRFAGWLGAHNRDYLAGVWKKLTDAGFADDVEHADAPTHSDKVRFLRGIDVLSVPAPYREPKGLYVLEALAAGVPVVQPRHGSFPELIEATGGGLLVNPDDPADLAAGLRRLLDDAELGRELGRKGQAAVGEKFTAEVMARETVAVLDQFVQRP